MKKCKLKSGEMTFTVVTGKEKEALPGTHLARTHFGGKYLTLRAGERGNVVPKGTYLVYHGDDITPMSKTQFDEKYEEIKESKPKEKAPAKTESKKKTGGKGANK